MQRCKHTNVASQIRLGYTSPPDLGGLFLLHHDLYVKEIIKCLLHGGILNVSLYSHYPCTTFRLNRLLGATARELQQLRLQLSLIHIVTAHYFRCHPHHSASSVHIWVNVSARSSTTDCRRRQDAATHPFSAFALRYCFLRRAPGNGRL